MTLVEHAVIVLRERGVPHAIIGAAALAAAGVARSTYDIDLLTTDRRVLDAQFWAHLRQAGVSVDARRGDSEDPLAGVVRLARDADRPVDLIVGRYAWQDRAIARAACGRGAARRAGARPRAAQAVRGRSAGRVGHPRVAGRPRSRHARA
jgi:hypothetical protein